MGIVREQILKRIAAERLRQIERYGTNEDLDWGNGPNTCWLLPFTKANAKSIETELREDYESWEDEVGKPTRVHLLREEIAEAFECSDTDCLEEELIQVAALAVSWIEDIYRKRGARC